MRRQGNHVREGQGTQHVIGQRLGDNDNGTQMKENHLLNTFKLQTLAK